MAWSDPTANLTFSNAEVVTHTKMNLIRDDLLETAPAKATTAGGYFVATGSNAIAERLSGSDTDIDTLRTTTSTSYVALTNAPAVTVTTGTKALAFIGGAINNDTGGNFAYLSIAVSGATTINTAAVLDDYALSYEASNASDWLQASHHHMFTGATALTAGSNTFTLNARVDGGSGGFIDMYLDVLPL